MRFTLLPLLLLSALPAVAATRVWDGGSPLTSSWTDAVNWGGNIAPVAGDTLVFPPVAARKTNTNNFPAGTVFNSIQVSGTDYVLQGNEAVLSALSFFITTAGTAPQVNLPLRASGPFGIQMTADTVAAGVVKGAINNAGFPVSVINLSGLMPIDIQSGISGAGGLTMSGVGLLHLSSAGTSTYAGTTTVEAGTLTVSGSNSPGDATGGTVVNSGARFNCGRSSLTENFTLSGTLTTGAPGDITLHGTLEITDAAARLEYANTSGVLYLDGAITGAHPLVKQGLGMVLITGNHAWSVPGLTIEEGRVILLRSGAAAGGVFTIGDGSGLADSAVLQAGLGAQLAVSSSLIIKPDGAYELAGHVQQLNGSITLEQGHLSGFGDLKLGGTITTLAAAEPSVIEGYIQLTASAAWNVADGPAPADLRMAAEITAATASPRITKNGAGRLDWTGNSTADFELSATAGTLLVNGINPEVRVFGSAGANIGGTGTVARLNPNNGSAANILPGGSTAGRMETRTLLFGPAAPGGTLRIQLNGPSPGTSHDQVRISASAAANSIRLDGGTLDVVSSNGFQPAFGQVFTIIDNQDDDTTLGIFAGLPQASVLTLNGKQLSLSYTGGDGNDVTLTCTTPSGALRTWTGGGTTNNWSDAANWGGTAPQTSDRLRFPEGAARPVNVNNLAAGFVLDSITLEGGGWTISGNDIGLLNGFVFTGAGAANTVSLSVTLLQSQNWATSRAAGSYNILSSVDLGSSDLSLTGSAGVIRFAAAVTGSGSLAVGSGVSCELFAANTFTGPLTLQSGSNLRIPHSGALGDPAGPTVLEAGATISITTSGFQTAEPFLCSGGTIYTGTNGPVLSGLVTLTSGAVSIETGGSGALTMSGVISGPGRLLKIGQGKLILTGALSNSHRYTEVLHGTVELNKTAQASAVLNDLIIHDTATVRLLASQQIHSSAPVFLNDGGVFDLNGFVNSCQMDFTGGTVRTGTAAGRLVTGDITFHAGAAAFIEGPGAVRIGTHRTWTVEDGPDDTDLTVSAVIESTEGAVLSKAGAGLMVSTAANTIPLMRVEEGSMELAGTSPASGVLLSGGTLYGQGRTASLSVDTTAPEPSFIEPGLSPGRFTTDVFQAPSGSGTLVVDINGPTAATGYDQIRVNASATADAVNLTGLVLQVRLTPAYTPPLGSTFRILDNNSADTVIGTMVGKPEGSMVTDGYVQFTISYAGGDVVLTTTGYFGTDRFWTGAGANNLWSTPANWQGGTVPLAGDRAYFPAAAARLQNVNDLPAGRFFSGLGIFGNYDISGNAITLSREFVMLHTSGSALFSLPVTLQTNVLWLMTGPASASCFCNGSIALAGNDLTIGGGIAINGVISGAGTVWLEPMSVNPLTSTTATLGGANTYTGRTVVTGINLVLNHAQALGSTAGQTRINAGASLRNASGQPVAEPLVLAGSLGATASGTDLYSGEVNILGDTAAIQPAIAASVIELTGNLTGSGQLTFNGPGRTRFSGGGTSTFTGSTTITHGTVELARTAPGAAGTLGNDIAITPSNGSLSATLRMDHANNQLSPSTVVSVGINGFLTLNGHTETIASLVLHGGAVGTTTASGELTISDLTVDSSIGTGVIHGPGALRMAASGEWSVPDGNSSPDLEISAVISGSAGAAITKTGGGSVLSTGANTIADIILESGSAQFDGLSPATAVLVQNATLKGSGQLRIVQVEDNSLTARIAPGSSAGRLRANALLFPASAEGVLEIELGGASPGTTFDQFQVESSAINNSVNLNGAALDLKLINSFTPAVGANFRILNNLDGDTSTGTFLGQPEASTFTAGGFTWSITYTGGDGNDVVITRINPSGVNAPAVVNFTNAFDPNAGGAGVPGRTIAFSGQGQAGQPYKLQASRNLTTWVDLATATANGSGVVTFNFVDTANLPRRLYRVVVP